MWFIIGMIAAVVVGVYVGLGMPGMPGRTDRVVPPGRARRLSPSYVHWFRPKRR
jgi:hypothetical protein